MANSLAPSARQKFLDADIDWSADTIKAVLLDSTYTYSSAHDFLDDVGGGARLATSGALGSKTSTAGVANSAAVVFTSVPGGDTVTQVWIYKDSGVEATSPLIAFYDTKADTSPISVVTDGTNITLNPNGAGLFTL